MTQTTPTPGAGELPPLKPCPFCGHVGLDFREGSTFRWLDSSCAGCGASTGETRIQTLGQGTKEEWMADAKRDAIAAWNRRAQAARTDLVPGAMRCAKCSFRLTRVNLNVNIGTVTAGDNKTEPCPNGCGPLWPITWEQEAREGYVINEQMFDRAVAAEKALAATPKAAEGEQSAPAVAASASDAVALNARRYEMLRGWGVRQLSLYVTDGNNPVYEEALDKRLDTAIDRAALTQGVKQEGEA